MLATAATQIGQAVGFALALLLVAGFVWAVASKWRRAYRAAKAYRAHLEAQVAANSASEAAAQAHATGGSVVVALPDAYGSGPGLGADGAVLRPGADVSDVVARRRAVGQVIEALPEGVADQVSEEDIYELLNELQPRPSVAGAGLGGVPVPPPPPPPPPATAAVDVEGVEGA